MIANCRANRPRNSRAIAPAEVHPFGKAARRKKPGITAEEFAGLKKRIKGKR